MRKPRTTALLAVPFLMAFGQNQVHATESNSYLAPPPDETGDVFYYGLNRVYPEHQDLTYLEQLVTKLKADQTLRVKIISHGCGVGSVAANMRVSEQRAKILKQYFIKYGITASRISLDWRGEQAPISDNGTNEGRNHNRRSIVQLIRTNGKIARGVKKSTAQTKMKWANNTPVTPKNAFHSYTNIKRTSSSYNNTSTSNISSTTSSKTVAQNTAVSNDALVQEVFDEINTIAQQKPASPFSNEEKYRILAEELSPTPETQQTATHGSKESYTSHSEKSNQEKSYSNAQEEVKGNWVVIKEEKDDDIFALVNEHTATDKFYTSVNQTPTVATFAAKSPAKLVRRVTISKTIFNPQVRMKQVEQDSNKLDEVQNQINNVNQKPFPSNKKEEEELRNTVSSPRKLKSNVRRKTEDTPNKNYNNTSSDVAKLVGSSSDRTATASTANSTATAKKALQFVDADTGRPIATKISIKTQTREVSLTTNYDGKGEIPGTSDLKGYADIFAVGYFMENERLKRGNNTQVIKLKKIKHGNKMTIEDLFFERGTANIMSKSYPELGRLVRTLKGNQNIKVEIGGHINVPFKKPHEISDRQLQISVDRAKSVYSYLISKGVPKNRLTYKGYGNSQMIYPEAMTTAEKAKNRRVEIKIIR